MQETPEQASERKDAKVKKQKITTDIIMLQSKPIAIKSYSRQQY
jgi:hypothetical protein